MRFALLACARTLAVAALVAALAPVTSSAGGATVGDPAAQAGAGIAGTDNGYLGVYADPLGTQPCATIPWGTVGTLYLIAHTAGGIAPGLTGVEFRVVVTNPEGYMFMYLAPPDATILLGDPLDLTPQDPFDMTGANVAFSVCQTGAQIPLGTIQVLNLSGGPTELWVERRNRPVNPSNSCPLFVGCGWPFDQFCMRPCGVDSFGGAVAATGYLNVPDCTPSACPASCPEAPCVTLQATGGPRVCPGHPVTITATATNCGPLPEDIDVYVEYALVASFSSVLPGQSVVASRTYPQPGCGVEQNRPAVGAVARNAACADPFGAEVAVLLNCVPTCPPNQPPDCSGAQPTVATLWPADGSLVPLGITGIADPDGEPVSIEIWTIGSDEPTGLYGSPDCPDAFLDGPNQVRLRAERASTGNGRVYQLGYHALDPGGAECSGNVTICVPRKPSLPCQSEGLFYQPRQCDPPFRGRDGSGGGVVTLQEDGSTLVRFAVAVEEEVQADVFDVRGRHVAALARSRFAPGAHVLRWAGRDDAGRPVAAGIYIVQLRIDGCMSALKTVVAR